MFVHYRTLGIFLKKENRGEADQLFTIFTKDFGKLKILGKAIRKIKSKLRSGAELFYLSEIEFIQGKAYKTLTDTILVDKFQNLRKDLEKLEISSEIAEIIDNLVKGEEADEKVWQLLLETFERINHSSLSPWTYYYFLWNFLSLLGYKPELNRCAVCQKKVNPDNFYFDSEQGGIVCQRCFNKEGKGIKVSPETIKIIRILLKKDWNLLSKLKVELGHKKELEEASRTYLCHLHDILGLS